MSFYTRSILKYLQILLPLMTLSVMFGIFTRNNPVYASNNTSWRTIERINGYSQEGAPLPKISKEGRYIAFTSYITDLVPNDKNIFCNEVAGKNCPDIFIYDRLEKTTQMVSISSSGTQSNGQSAFPSISYDARYIAFQSQASNLVPDGAHNCLYIGGPPIPKQCTDIFVRDLISGITERVSVDSSGTEANGYSTSPSISADGRYIAFSSNASNLIPNGTHTCQFYFYSTQCTHIFVHDRLTRITKRVSETTSGERGNYGGYKPSISPDGHYVAFLSSSSNLAPFDNNDRLDVFIHNIDSGETEPVSIALDGTIANQGVELIAPAISSDGRNVAFVSKSTNLVENDTNGVADIFVRDLETGNTIRVNIGENDMQANSKSGDYNPSISTDGRYALFDSYATNLVSDDTNNHSDIFIRDIVMGKTSRVSLAEDGSEANGMSFSGTISPDGKLVSFDSFANNLISGDSNNQPDIFVATVAPTFPYFSQIDPAWKNNEYDHGNSIGPFFCGTTIGGCGCAITSSAMLLKYHGATKAPNGQETNPDILNTWLKENKGYAFGALKWNSIAAYSVKANQNFGTQKIRFVGTGPSNNYSMLNTDLANNKPVILQEPGHFIVAKSKQSPTYAINDPAFVNKTTLESYSNNFLSMRRFEKTNTDLSALYISTPAPNDILITDSKGRRAGKSQEQTYTEIPNSFYFLEPEFPDQTQENPQSPPEGSGVNMLVIINPDLDTYNLQSSQSGPIDFSSYDVNGDITVKEFNPNASEKFEINYSPEPGAPFNVFQNIGIDIKSTGNNGNGVVPVFILSDQNFDTEDIDLSSIKFGPEKISPEKESEIYVSNSNEKEKDLLTLFRTNLRDMPENARCLIGATTEGQSFKGCDP